MWNLIHDRLHEPRALVPRPSEQRLLKWRPIYWPALSFLVVMNYNLRSGIVVARTGTQAFNEAAGRMTLVSRYPMIAIPSMIMMVLILVYLWKTIMVLTGP